MAALPSSLYIKTEDIVLFEPGQVVFEEGQPGDFMYVVLEGEVEVLIDGKVAEVIAPDGIFGELALIDYKTRSATVRARTQTRLAQVDQMRFSFLVQHNPYFAIQVMQTMASRLRRQVPC